VIDLDLFAGPGGWSTGAQALGIADVGIELDVAACATRAAAGHKTIRANAAAFAAGHLEGKVRGFIGSPPCTQFSAAGNQAGNAVTTELAASIRDLFAGKPTRAKHRKAMFRALRDSRWLIEKAPAKVPPGADRLWTREAQDEWKRKLRARKDSRAKRLRAQMTDDSRYLRRAERSARYWAAVRSASLVVEPARFIHACIPEWVAMEQVPAVLPLWEVYAAELRKMGYSAWCGKLNAADYGVPQTRERAILIASRVRQVSRPEPTHYDPRKGDQLWGTPWASMAAALGWGATGRPVPTVTAGGTATGGADSLARGGREALEAERDAGRWALRKERGAGMLERGGQRRDHPLDEPAPTVTAGVAGSGPRLPWALHTNRGQRPDGTRQTADPATAPAPALTAKSGGQWVVKAFRNNNNNNNACERSIDEPAGTLFFGQRSNWAAWTVERPATTVQGDPRLGRPGHKDRDKGERQFEVDSVRITVEEAAALQSFPRNYAWQGTKTAQFRQVGDAVPPLLAIAVLGVATGADWQPVAERYAESCRLLAAHDSTAEDGEAVA
jgi:DNA (cytosine-5)-methyltransferase 1